MTGVGWRGPLETGAIKEGEASSGINEAGANGESGFEAFGGEG